MPDIIALSGSLRAASYNTAFLRALAGLAPDILPAGFTVFLHEGLDQLPFFNPDLEEAPPLPALQFCQRVGAADAIIIASPEYAHGVTGVIKNALDWLVGGEAVVDKPVAVLNLSPLAVHADAALRETLAVMSARVIAEASLKIPLLGSGLDAEGIMADAGLAADIRQVLEILILSLSPAGGTDAGRF